MSLEETRVPWRKCNVGRMSHLNAMDVVVSLCPTANDPRGLAHAHTALDHQRVDRHCAVVISIVELMSLKRVVVLEVVEAGDKLRAGTYLTAARANGKKKKQGVKSKKNKIRCTCTHSFFY